VSLTDPAPAPHAWAVYLIECADGRVYTGIARDPDKRYAQHAAGTGAKFTRSNPPRRLLGWTWVASKSAALKLEIAWKRLPRAERIAALKASATTQHSP
jgi:putative endonuclease